MAELGTIPPVDLNAGIRPIDRSAETRLFAQGLETAKTVVNESIKGSVTKDMMGAIDDIASVDRQIESDGSPTVYGEGTREAYLTSRLDRLQNVIKQGKTSQVTLAQNQVKEILGEAQYKYPWLYEELQSRAGQVMAGSSRLEELALLDAANKQAAKMASGEYDAIVKQAQDLWKDGGYGINPAIEVGSPQFNALYRERSKLRAQSEDQIRQTTMKMVNAEQDLNNDDTYYGLIAGMSGEYSAANAAIENLRQGTGFNQLAIEIGKGANANVELIRQYHQGLIGTMGPEIAKIQAGMNEWWDNFVGPEWEATTRGQRLRKRFDDQVATFNLISSGLSAEMDSIPSAMQFIDSVMAVQQMVQYQKLDEPGRQAADWLTSPAGKEITKLSVSGVMPDSQILNQRLGVMTTDIMKQRWPDFVGAGTGPTADQVIQYNSSGVYGVTTGMSPSDINKRIRARVASSESTGIVPASNQREEILLALDSADKHLMYWKAALDGGSSKDSPKFAADRLTGLNHSLNIVNLDDQNYAEVSEALLPAFAMPEIKELILAVGDSANTNERQALGDSLMEFYASTEPQTRRASASQKYTNTLVSSVPLSSIAKIDVMMLGENKFRWKNDKALVTQAAQNRVNRTATPQQFTGAKMPALNSSYTLAQAVTEVENEINAYMRDIATEVTQQIAIQQNIDLARSESIDQVQGQEFKDYFLGTNDSGNLLWSDVFNYTTSGEVSSTRAK
jgi:hypothetical protein